jgi:hypothetical protein
MSKRFIFLIFFVLVLGLAGSAPAASIDVNNGSFEYDVNGVQITEWTGWDDVKGWTLRDTTGWAGGYWGVDDEWGAGYEAADGNVASFNVTGFDPLDPNTGVVEIYQIFEDANAVIDANHRYTLTFNALRLSVTETPIAYGALFYSTGEGEANDVILASEARTLTAPTFSEPDYAGWEEIKITYIALSGAGSDGETLGVKFNNPYPWIEGYAVAMDNVRVDFDWATTAWDPIPKDGAEDVSRSPTLKWKPGLWAANTGGHLVFLGTDYAEVYDANTNTADIYKGPRDVNNYSPGTLDLGKVYYWRIDEVNSAYSGSNPPAGPWKGDVWGFEVTGYPKNPNPAHLEEDVPFLNLTLSWTAGTDATSHDVYFSSNYANVDDANTSTSSVYRGNKAVTYYLVPESTATGLTAGKTYYWRIDECSAGNYVLKGKIWRFTIGEFLIVDNFDGYANNPELYAVWDDYWTNGTKAEIFLQTADANFIRDGNSLRYKYTNTAKSGANYLQSRIDANDPAELEVGKNWTVGGVKSLTLYFIGDVTNTWAVAYPNGHRLWVQLKEVGTDVKLVQHTDVNDMNEPIWHEWNIPLKTFSDAGVNLSNLDCVSIGIGGTLKVGQSKAAKGQIHIDDIRLYPPRCFPELAQIVGNLNGDCIVDNQDLDIFGGDWLVSDYNAQGAPPTYPPEVWYRFDEGSGSTVLHNDGSWGSQYDIAISSPNAVDEPKWTTDVKPPIEACDPNYALDFDGGAWDAGGDYLEIPNTPDNKFVGTQNMTIAAWIKPAADMGEWDWPVLVESRKDGENASGFGFGGWGELIYWWNNVEWEWHSDLWTVTDQWNFVAVTIEPTQATIYLGDGSSLNSATHTPTYSATHEPLTDWDTGFTNMIAGNTIPRSPFFYGKIDDVRLYNKTLTRGEIMGLSGLSGEIYVPNDSSANFAPKTPPPTTYDPNNPDIVNFVDYEILANNWLSEYLWPPE